jgi:hypothetical protein
MVCNGDADRGDDGGGAFFRVWITFRYINITAQKYNTRSPVAARINKLLTC